MKAICINTEDVLILQETYSKIQTSMSFDEWVTYLFGKFTKVVYNSIVEDPEGLGETSNGQAAKEAT